MAALDGKQHTGEFIKSLVDTVMNHTGATGDADRATVEHALESAHAAGVLKGTLDTLMSLRESAARITGYTVEGALADAEHAGLTTAADVWEGFFDA